LAASFAPLRVRDLRVFFAGQALSLIGTWMQATGLSWLVWKLTHSTAALGTVAMFTFLPFLLLAPQAGTWADRWDRRKLLVRVQVVALAVAVALAELVQSHTVELWQLYLAASVLGLLATLEMASRPVFIGDLAGRALLRRAIALNSSMTQASRMVGPALAGVIIAVFGISAAFWINAASFLAVIASLLAVHGAQQTRPVGSGRHGFGEAVSFLRATPGLRELILFSTLLTFFAMSASSVFPAIADDVLDGNATTLGWLLTASGAGALLGALIGVPLLQKFERVGLLAGVATIWAGVFLVGFSLSRSLALSLACLLLSGLAFPVVITTTVGMLQLLGPPQMRSRLQSALLMVTFGIQPAAALAIGWTARVLGAPVALRINALLLVLGASLLLAGIHSLREWRPRHANQQFVDTLGEQR
ncbi:MAG: MFS transporter, partial [Pseudonocardiales bacterium]